MAKRSLPHRHVRLSKFLSLLLRHNPARFPVTLDERGYAELGEVMAILNALPNFRWASRRDVEAVVDAPGRRRFEIVGERIRALYGHTALRVTYEPLAPPTALYHATAPERVGAILSEGLCSMERQYVHLSPTVGGALSIGRRHAAEPVLLRVDAAAAHRDGFSFYHPVDEIYLTADLPARYLEVEEEG